MKISIAWSDGEELSARTVEEFARAFFTDVKVRKSDRHPPFQHMYLTTGKPRKRCKSKKIT